MAVYFNREIKLDVTWSYVKRQTTNLTSQFVFFSSNPSLNHIKIEKCLPLFATNTNIFTLLFKELKTDGQSFIFAVCRLTYDHVTSNLISLISIFPLTLSWLSSLHKYRDAPLLANKQSPMTSLLHYLTF